MNARELKKIIEGAPDDMKIAVFSYDEEHSDIISHVVRGIYITHIMKFEEVIGIEILGT